MDWSGDDAPEQDPTPRRRRRAAGGFAGAVAEARARSRSVGEDASAPTSSGRRLRDDRTMFDHDLDAWLDARDAAIADYAGRDRRRATIGAPSVRDELLIETLEDNLDDEWRAGDHDVVHARAFGGAARPAILFGAACALLIGTGLFASGALTGGAGVGGGVAYSEADMIEPIRTASTADPVVAAPATDSAVRSPVDMTAAAAAASTARADRLAARPNPRLAGELDPAPAYATGSVPRYLGARDLDALLRARPVKCVFSDVAGAPARDAIAALDVGASGRICAATTNYRIETGLFTTNSGLVGDATLEINAAFAIDGDMLCHETAGLSALVLGEAVPFDEAVSLERLVKSSYLAEGDGRICYRLRDLSASHGEGVFRADAFIAGAYRPDRTDPRPFLMRARR